MAGDDDDDDDDVNDHVTVTTATSPMGLPPTVVALLGRMTSYRDRMAWTVVEDACRVCLTLSWDVDERRRGDGRRRSRDAGSASCKQSLWSRIRRSLHQRRSISVDSTAATDFRRHQHHQHQQHQPSSSRDPSDDRARAARELWRSAVRRHRSTSTDRGSMPGTSDPASWRRQRQRSWNASDVVEPATDVKDLAAASQSRGRLLPSMSLPERFLSPPPLHPHQQHHLQQHHQLTPQDEFVHAHLPQYDYNANSVRQTQPSVSSRLIVFIS